MQAELTEYFFAQVSSTVMNTGFRSTEKPTSPADFMPSQRNKPARQTQPNIELSSDDVLDRLRQMFPREK
jgi:hypothetical protein